MEIPEFTKASSKGQIVLPIKVRKKLDIRNGSMFSVSADKNMIVLKKLDSEMKAEDLKTLKLIKQAWKDIENGRYKKMTPEKFFKELAKWKK